METIVTMYLFGSLWSKWQLAFKIATPLLHLAFSAAQVHGSMIFWRMYKRQKRYLAEKRQPDEESGQAESDGEVVEAEGKSTLEVVKVEDGGCSGGSSDSDRLCGRLVG